MFKSTLLFYRKLEDDFKKEGFTSKLYDPCMANKEIKRKQMMVTWHVDDLKIPLMDDSEVGKIIKYLKSIYGQNITELNTWLP